jgi:membrane protease YdiL (CAAX protease family)
MNMKSDHLPTSDWVERIILALLFIGIGGPIIVVFKPWGRQLIADPVDNYLWRLGVSGILLVLALLARRRKRFEKFWQLLLAMFILSTALSLDWVFGQFLYNSLHLSDAEPIGWMYEKLHEVVLIVSVIIVCNKLSGNSLGAIYIQKGNLKLGLLIGGIAFLISVAGSIPTAELLFKGNGLTVARVLPWAPGVLVIVLANGTLEELLFRGLFLRKLEAFFGKFLSNVLIALVFTVLHKGSTYTSSEYIFLVILTPLALVLGWVMQKTDSVWGSILFHAGMDIPVFLGIFSNL